MDPAEHRGKGWGLTMILRGTNFERAANGASCVPEDLNLFSTSFYDDYLIERLSGIGFGIPPSEMGVWKADS